jgi:molecular chaperone GrpE
MAANQKKPSEQSDQTPDPREQEQAAASSNANAEEPEVVEHGSEKVREAEPAAGLATDDADESETSILIKQLADAESRAQDFQQRYLRSVSDLDNYRKRMAREKQDTIRDAARGIIEDLLPALDNLKLGLEAARQQESGDEDLVKGLEMVVTQINNALGQHGLVELQPTGADFDPNQHEAVAHEPNEDVPEGKIVEVRRTGYLLNDRLIRPAHVVVSKGREGNPGEA